MWLCQSYPLKYLRVKYLDITIVLLKLIFFKGHGERCGKILTIGESGRRVYRHSSYKSCDSSVSWNSFKRLKNISKVDIRYIYYGPGSKSSLWLHLDWACSEGEGDKPLLSTVCRTQFPWDRMLSHWVSQALHSSQNQLETAETESRSSWVSF